MLAVLLSERANRTALSTAVVFLGAGFLLGRGGLGVVDLGGADPLVGRFAEAALIAILFVEGSGLSVRELASAWRLPGRALLVGMPLTLVGIALAGRLLLGLTWTEALLMGAILSPTDPVLVATILEQESVPVRLRRVLQVESGLNDGLALPFVVVLLARVGHREAHIFTLLFEAGMGAVVGAAVAAGFLWLESRRVFGTAENYRPLAGIAIIATTYGVTQITSTNEFLAAFTAGVTLASMQPKFADHLRTIGGPISETVKLATLLVFGAVLTLPALTAPGARGWIFAALVLVAARPAALILAFLGGGLSRREWLAAAWFGPKGFASLLYALLVAQAGLPRSFELFEIAALVIVVSVVAHSSTDVAVARVFTRAEQQAERPRGGSAR